MLDLPVWPTDVERPVIESWASVLVFGGYSGLMLTAVVATTMRPVTGPQLGAVLVGNVLVFSLLVLAVVSFRRRADLDRETILVTAYGNLSFLIAYFVVYEGERFALSTLGVAATDRLLGVLIVFEEAVLLAVLLGFMARSIHPEIPAELDREAYYLELYMTNLWRVFRVALAVIVAIGVGIVVTLFAQFGSDTLDVLVVHLVLSAVPGAVLVTHVILQLEYVINLVKRTLRE